LGEDGRRLREGGVQADDADAAGGAETLALARNGRCEAIFVGDQCVFPIWRDGKGNCSGCLVRKLGRGLADGFCRVEAGQQWSGAVEQGAGAAIGDGEIGAVIVKCGLRRTGRGKAERLRNGAAGFERVGGSAEYIDTGNAGAVFLTGQRNKRAAGGQRRGLERTAGGCVGLDMADREAVAWGCGCGGVNAGRQDGKHHGGGSPNLQHGADPDGAAPDGAACLNGDVFVKHAARVYEAFFVAPTDL
jgi:hypothetical protein